LFDDFSFLIDSFAEDPKTGVYTAWLTLFGADGQALGAELVVPSGHTAPVWLAATRNGALAAWSWNSLFVLPVDRSGAPTGPSQTVVANKEIYEMAILPAPDGDVLAVWTELEPDNVFAMYVEALAPDGTARGPATLVQRPAAEVRIRGVVERSGARALLTIGTEALPLTCVH
jgi:hypothetical protein